MDMHYVHKLKDIIVQWMDTCRKEKDIRIRVKSSSPSL